MTPKEKAQELVNKYLTIEMSMYINDLPYMLLSKQCALIAVSEMIEVLCIYEDISKDYDYWQEVKQEIETYGGGDK